MSVCSQLTFAATEDADAATTAAELAQTVEELNALDQWFTEAEKTRNNLQTQIRSSTETSANSICNTCR